MKIPNIYGRDIFKKNNIVMMDNLLLSKKWKILQRDEIRGVEIHFLYEWNKLNDDGMFYRKIYQDLKCDADIFDRYRVLNASLTCCFVKYILSIIKL